MISRASLFSSSSTTWARMAPRLCSVFLARRNLDRRAERRLGITSSTTRMVDRSRQVASAVPPVVVRVVTPRTTLTCPPTLSTGVTPPRISRSRSPSPSRADTPFSPVSTAPPRGTAGSLSPAMAPATAAARVSPDRAVPKLSTPPGATSTTRSLFRPLARSTRLATLSSLAPATTASRSRRASEAAATLSRRSACTSSSVLSQITRAMSSVSASRSKAS